MIDEDQIIKKYDYKPFGDTLWTSSGSLNRDNFDGSTYDAESDLQMLGFRMYDNETGRFTTPDLLWSVFPAQTPYHYAYNSPLTYRDPSGLAPEKEKDREELLDLNPDYLSGGYEFGIWNANEIERYNGMTNYWNNIFSGLDETSSSVMNWKDAFNTNYGDGGGRTGKGGGAWKITNEWTDEVIKKYQEYYSNRVDQAMEKGEKEDCMDFQALVLVEFAKDNGLPLHFNRKNGKGINMKDYDSFDSFWSDVAAGLTAKNLDLLYNTEMIPFDEREPGDMKLIEFGDDMHVIGYYDKKQITYGNLDDNNKPTIIEKRNDWTIGRRYLNYNIVGVDNGELIYGPKYLLRWQFKNFNKGGK